MVVSIPSEGTGPAAPRNLCARRYRTCELDGYVYVCLEYAGLRLSPFRIAHHGERGWHTIRLQNRFRNTVGNCVENFIDIPHTVFVHKKLFRSIRGEKFIAGITRKDGEVHVTYRNERGNLGTYAWFLNPREQEIQHTDSFYMPNVTCVRYALGPHRQFNITSQSVPVSESETLVYTDLTYNFGAWTRLASWFVRRQGQRIIDQDLEILEQQMEVIRKYDSRFISSPSDRIHEWVDSIRNEIARGGDPRQLPEVTAEVDIWV
jgi:phenylpropionate dioxygenase-like ring-hydroxylating dioxygenase large terminal subunit